MPLFARWRAQREHQRRTASYVDSILRSPPEEDVIWLSSVATGGDLDHARWELRYARRALGLLTAERDALDDRTGSAVARALTERLERDPAVAAEMRDVADRQFNARLSAYRDVISSRPGAPANLRLGQMLLAFAGGPIGLGHAEVAHAGEVMTAYMTEANERLRDAYGAAALPEDIAPSELTPR
jgi:hypothetical protein